ncbi:hypothetical protein [Demequina oxidasica]|uniref:hypothetical protein n=1 Tax=Demequina oxidasica TaxID=676199 RepID=UPI00078155E5|nr:hypothetical protein [Demequina oxidasica]
MPKPLIIVAAVLVACVSAAAGWFGVKAWRDSQTVAAPVTTPSPPPSATPGDDTVSLTFDVGAINFSVADLHSVPQCGETYAPEKHIANEIEARVDGAVMLDDGLETLEANPGFRVTGDEARAFLAGEGTVVVTRDDVVVSPDWGAEFVPEYYVAEPNNTTYTEGKVSMNGAELCDVADDLSAIWDDIDWATATEAEIAVAQEKATAFKEEHKDLPAGEYKIYMLSPVILGEPAAIARVLTEEGISGLATLQYTIAYSSLAEDPEVKQYCDTLTDADGNPTEVQCDVPVNALLELLRRDVPVSYIVEGDPEEAISDAYSLTVD